MKIAIDISQVIYGTGVSVYTKNLVTTLIKNYPDTEFFLFGGSLRRQGDLKKFINRLKANGKIFPIPPTFFDFLWNSFHVLPVEKLIGNVDLVHTSDWAEPPSKLPKVTTVHDLIPFKYPQTVAAHVRAAHRKRLAWVVKESDLILAVSKSTKNDLIDRFKINEDRVIVTYEGVEDIFCPQTPDAIKRVREKYNLGPYYLFSLSTLEPRKNQHRLIKAFSLIKQEAPKLKLLIGGRSGWGEGLPKVKDVLMPGFIPDADLPALYAGSLSYVLPSLYEGFSLSHLQAMACGAPVVASNVSSMPEVVGKAGILVNPEDEKDIAAGIIKSINQSKELSQKARERSKLFTWDETAHLTHKAYIKAIKNHSSK